MEEELLRVLRHHQKVETINNEQNEATPSAFPSEAELIPEGGLPEEERTTCIGLRKHFSPEWLRVPLQQRSSTSMPLVSEETELAVRAKISRSAFSPEINQESR